MPSSPATASGWSAARDDVATCAISGAVGTFANVPPAVEEHVAAELGLGVEPVSTQVIPRDRHAMFFATLGVIASSIERLATEIRHLQRTEVLEAEEYFSPGQKGSSAMPHKRNPVLTENLTGLARMVRGYVTPALENVALWHERDISHSSVERFIGPDATITLDFALGAADRRRSTSSLVYPERMQKNLDRMGGLVHSQRVLLALTQAGLSREDSYALVQRNAMKVWESDGELSLLDLLKADPEVSQRLSAERARCAVRPRLSLQARRHDLRPGVRRDRLSVSQSTILMCTAEIAGYLASADGTGGMDTVRNSTPNGCRGSARRRTSASSRRGYLLELSLDWIVLRASENIHHLLGESHVTLIDEPLGKFVHAQALHDLRNLFSRLSGTTGIGRAYAVRLTDDHDLVDIAFQLSRRPRAARSGARRADASANASAASAASSPGLPNSQRPGAARRRRAADAGTDRL